MKWQEVTVTTEHEAVEAVSNIFHELGAGGVVVEDPNVVEQYINSGIWDYYELPSEMLEVEHVLIKGYLPVDTELPERLEQLKTSLTVLKNQIPQIDIQVNTAEVAEEDWANSWKAYYKPEKITERIVVVPSWEEYQSHQGELTIELDPGMAFGTGTHSTTKMSIQLLETVVNGDETVFDVGTGTGVISIAAAKLGCKSVFAADLDLTAVNIAKQNVEINGVKSSVEVVQGNLLEPLMGKETPQIIVANIIADVIMLMAEDAYNTLEIGGYFITSGIIDSRGKEVKDKLSQMGFTIERIIEEKDWVAILAKKE
ncbi:ribosomal protein L11 methyltransferase [Desulfitispora alkaliphila]|uniref:50S ribosomal protein L11 methyltransferase n=1 Tax=Desulfitispora alkaliphila TaxID=622674 RepID=UPI003D1A2E16